MNGLSSQLKKVRSAKFIRETPAVEAFHGSAKGISMGC